MIESVIFKHVISWLFLHCAFPVGFNVETVAYKRINFTTWDVGNRSGSVSGYLYF